MNGTLFISAVLLFIGWAVGVFALNASGLIHALLIIGLLTVIFGFLRRA